MDLPINENNIKNMLNKINYEFENTNYLYNSLIHSSYINENEDCVYSDNERMEFLGDSILSLIISDFLYKNFSEKDEKEMSIIRSNIVSRKNLKVIGKQINLDKCVVIGGRKDNEVPNSVLSDAVEALIAAIYLDSNYSLTYDIIIDLFKEQILELIKHKNYYDSKILLQQYSLAKFNSLPEYKVLNVVGPDHARVYTVAVFLNEEQYSVNSGKSMKEAQKNAASDALKFIDKNKDIENEKN